jgi:hypothetical protein
MSILDRYNKKHRILTLETVGVPHLEPGDPVGALSNRVSIDTAGKNSSWTDGAFDVFWIDNYKMSISPAKFTCSFETNSYPPLASWRPPYPDPLTYGKSAIANLTITPNPFNPLAETGDNQITIEFDVLFPVSNLWVDVRHNSSGALGPRITIRPGGGFQIASKCPVRWDGFEGNKVADDGVYLVLIFVRFKDTEGNMYVGKQDITQLVSANGLGFDCTKMFDNNSRGVFDETNANTYAWIGPDNKIPRFTLSCTQPMVAFYLNNKKTGYDLETKTLDMWFAPQSTQVRDQRINYFRAGICVDTSAVDSSVGTYPSTDNNSQWGYTDGFPSFYKTSSLFYLPWGGSGNGNLSTDLSIQAQKKAFEGMRHGDNNPLFSSYFNGISDLGGVDLQHTFRRFYYWSDAADCSKVTGFPIYASDWDNNFGGKSPAAINIICLSNWPGTLYLTAWVWRSLDKVFEEEPIVIPASPSVLGCEPGKTGFKNWWVKVPWTPPLSEHYILKMQFAQTGGTGYNFLCYQHIYYESGWGNFGNDSCNWARIAPFNERRSQSRNKSIRKILTGSDV